MPLDEDLRRYTAPPDNPPEETTYLLSQILRHVENWAPNPYNYHHTLDEVRDILKEASDNLTNEDYGIDTV
jgi:hypothetical protein